MLDINLDNYYDERRKDTAETYEIVSKVGYLIGVNKAEFEKEFSAMKQDVYDEMEKSQNARIIRCLCILRTNIERNYQNIWNAMNNDLCNLDSLPQFVSRPALMQLEEDGISIIKANCKLDQYIININALIAHCINNCKDIFPGWLRWEYLRKLFIMPDGQTERGIKTAGRLYYGNKNEYPYQCYINWTLFGNGNILYNDKKFVSLLYKNNRDRFEDFSKVTDAGQMTKDDVIRFVDQHRDISIVIDCENADPYKFYGLLTAFEDVGLLGNVVKIMLYDDVHASTVWSMLERFTEIPVEHHMTQRIKADKSMVDANLMLDVLAEHLTNQVDAFILVSSDSDYWSLISHPHMKAASFLVLLEQNKCSSAIIETMNENGVAYSWLDNFCTSKSSRVVSVAIQEDVEARLQGLLGFNMKDLFEEACEATRAELAEDEKGRLYERLIKPLVICFSPDGEPIIQLGKTS